MVDIETIIKAYKFCKNNEGTCDKCLYFPKKSKMYGCPINNDMISAISEQKAEIDRLKAEQPKKGHWEKSKLADDRWHICSECGVLTERLDRNGFKLICNFCRICGADMRGEQDG